MGKLFRYKLFPTVFGGASCLLLIVSRVLQRFNGRSVEMMNYLLVFVTLCLCVHFVRRTAQLSDRHVWEVPALIALICIPVFNLAVAIISLLFPTAAVLQSRLLSALLVLFSLPTFFCCYFLYVFLKRRADLKLRIASFALFAVGGAYLAMRLCDGVIFPLIERYTVYELIPEAHVFVSRYPALSIGVYLLAFHCFLFFGALLRRDAKEELKEEEA